MVTLLTIDKYYEYMATGVYTYTILYVQLIRDSVSATSEKFSFVLLEPEQLKSLNIRILKEVCHHSAFANFHTCTSIM